MAEATVGVSEKQIVDSKPSGRLAKVLESAKERFKRSSNEGTRYDPERLTPVEAARRLATGDLVGLLARDGITGVGDSLRATGVNSPQLGPVINQSLERSRRDPPTVAGYLKSTISEDKRFARENNDFLRLISDLGYGRSFNFLRLLSDSHLKANQGLLRDWQTGRIGLEELENLEGILTDERDKAAGVYEGSLRGTIIASGIDPTKDRPLGTSDRQLVQAAEKYEYFRKLITEVAAVRAKKQPISTTPVAAVEQPGIPLAIPASQEDQKRKPPDYEIPEGSGFKKIITVLRMGADAETREMAFLLEKAYPILIQQTESGFLADHGIAWFEPGIDFNKATSEEQNRYFSGLRAAIKQGVVNGNEQVLYYLIRLAEGRISRTVIELGKQSEFLEDFSRGLVSFERTRSGVRPRHMALVLGIENPDDDILDALGEVRDHMSRQDLVNYFEIVKTVQVGNKAEYQTVRRLKGIYPHLFSVSHRTWEDVLQDSNAGRSSDSI